MTPCELCWRNHWGTRCDGTPLMLLADWELPPEPECPLCYSPMNQSDRACTLCRREAAVFVPMLLGALEELFWRRVNHETLGGSRPLAYIQRTVVVAEPEETTTVRSADAATREDAGMEQATGPSAQAPLTAPSIYAIVETLGGIAALGLALGSLAHLSAVLGGLPW